MEKRRMRSYSIIKEKVESGDESVRQQLSLRAWKLQFLAKTWVFLFEGLKYYMAKEYYIHFMSAIKLKWQQTVNSAYHKTLLLFLSDITAFF